MNSISRTISLVLGLGLLVLTGTGNPVASQDSDRVRTVSLVTAGTAEDGAAHGLEQLSEVLTRKGLEVERVQRPAASEADIRVLAWTTSERDSSTPPSPQALPTGLQDSLRAGFRERDESFLMHPAGEADRPTIFVAGSDERGLMYGLLHLTERIEWSPDHHPFEHVTRVSKQPNVADRSIVKVVTNQSEFEQYFYDEEYWDRYLSRLAESRFNTFQLQFGYRALGYFEPIYPFLFDVAGFDSVRVVGLSQEKQRRNLEMLRRIIAMSHEHGLDFTLGLWTHIYRVDEPVEGVPYGLTDENLIPYSKAGLARLLEELPGLDAIQFRVHTESALNLPRQQEFWREILQVIRRVQPELHVDMRAKGFTDDMIDAALSTGVSFRMVTKYWGEQMGLPYHPTHLKGKEQFKRRHGYANLLRYPKRYEMLWRLWNHGTTRLLLWGSPDYVRRFAESTHLYGGDGYEVYEPLATKMWKNREGQTFDIHQSPYRFYDWEFERYWHFYELFGRIGYDSDTDPRVWGHSFNEHFGPDVGPLLEEALHEGSQILPRIVAYLLPELSASRSWAGFQRWQDLPDYIEREPSDPAQFVGIQEAAELMVEGASSPKIWPQETSRWFQARADTIRRLIREAEQHVGTNPGGEFLTTVVDLKVLAHLAEYHAHRIHAGLNLALHNETGSLHAFDDALRYERRAIDAWKGLVEEVRGVYADSLVFGSNTSWGYLTGHWSDELKRLQDGLQQLEARRDTLAPVAERPVARFDFGDASVAEGFYPVERDRTYPRHTMDARTFGVEAREGVPRYGSGETAYGWWHHYTASSPEWRSEDVQPPEERDFVRGPDPYARWQAYNHSAFTADLPNGWYRLDFSMADRSASPTRYGPMWIVANGKERTEPFTVGPGERIERTLETEVVSNQVNVTFKSESTSQWLINSLALTRIGPVINHVPVRTVRPGQDLPVRATVAGSDPLDSVVVRWQTENGKLGTRELIAEGPYQYRGEISGDEIGSGTRYWVEAVDTAGRASTFPHEGPEDPAGVTVTSDSSAPTVDHEPVRSARPGHPVRVSAEVSDGSGVRYVRLKYRAVNQHQDYRSVRMRPTDEKNVYAATIPEARVEGRWDLMYYIETMDTAGNGTIHPSLSERTPYVVVSLDRDK